MKKIESEYINEYGDIPRDENERFKKLIRELKFSKNARKELFAHIRRNLNITWKTVSFTIYLLPKATPRPRHNIQRNIFYVKGAKDNKDIFKKFITKCDVDMINTPCKFYCISYLPIPKSFNSVEKVLAEMGLIRPIAKPDWDNLGKTYSDMIQGTLLFDDSLIIEGVSKKYYSTKPRIEIKMEYMDGYDSIYNERKMRKKVDM